MESPHEMDTIEALLSSPSICEQKAYHDELLRNYAPGLEVRYDTANGKALFTTLPVAKGACVLRDPPLVALQHFQNRKHCLCCDRCLKFIGSIGSQVASHLRPDLFPACPQARAAIAARRLRESGEDQSGYESDAYSDEDVEFDDELMRRVGLGEVALPYAELFPLDPAVPCRGGCCDVAYCSTVCAEEDWSSHHRLLCMGGASEGAGPSSARAHGEASETDGPSGSAVPSAATAGMVSRLHVTEPSAFESHRDLDALWSFYRLAHASNDTFVLAAKVIAQVLLAAERRLAQAPQLSAAQCLLSAALPYRTAHKELWWTVVGRRAMPPDSDADEAAAGPSPSSTGSPEDAARQARDLATQAAALLKQALWRPMAGAADKREPESEDRRATLVRACEALFDPQWFASVMGIFELNNLSFEIENPVEDYFLHIDGLSDRREKKQVQRVTQPLLDALGRRYCLYAEGTAFYPLQSCCNHACTPACETMRRETDRDATAGVYALRDLAPGAEVTISYIDLVEVTEDPRGRRREAPRSVEDRQEDLLDYGFDCRCARCVRELGLGGTGATGTDAGPGASSS